MSNDTTRPPVNDSELARLRAGIAESRKQQAQQIRPGAADPADAELFSFELRSCLAELKAAREAAGLTLAQVAERTGLAVEMLGQLEAGTVTNPTWRTLGLYATAVGRKLRLSTTE
jgi:hypothetical protein